MSTKVAVTKGTDCGLNSRHLLPHSSGGKKSKVKVLAGLVYPEVSPFEWQVADFSVWS